MDYGQPVKTGNDPEFFTSGAGTNAENVNNFEAENNLDLTNNQTNWTPSVERDNRGLGNSAMQGLAETSSGEQSLNQMPEIPQNPLEKETALGEVVNMEMPPGANQNDSLTTGEVAKKAISFDKNKIKTGDTLDENGIQAVNATIDKFNQDGNTDDFYGEWQRLVEINLENSYGRKIGEEKAKAA